MKTSEDVCPVKVERREKSPTKRVNLYHDWHWKRLGKDKDGAELRRGICRLCGYKLPATRMCRQCGLRLDHWGSGGSLCDLCIEDDTRALQPVGAKGGSNDTD